MRTIPNCLLVAALAGGLAVACSQAATDHLTRPDGPAVSGAAALSSFDLVGDGRSLALHGAPADDAYEASYRIAGFTQMTVTVDAVGALSASCATAAGKAACKDLPFYSSVTAAGGKNHVTVVDVYGHKLVDASPVVTPSGGAPPASPPISFDAGALGAVGACAPSVTASISGCSMTIDGTTCDCSDCDCVQGAVLACLGDAGVPEIDVDASALPGVPGLGGGAGCDPATIDKVKLQFCADVDAKLAAAGVAGVSLDCAAIGGIPTNLTPPPASPASNDCADLTHDAFVKVRQSLATCDPCSYVTWDSSARLQLVDDGACDPFF